MEFRKTETADPMCRIPPLSQSFPENLCLVLCSLCVDQHIPPNLAHEEYWVQDPYECTALQMQEYHLTQADSSLGTGTNIFLCFLFFFFFFLLLLKVLTMPRIL